MYGAESGSLPQPHGLRRATLIAFSAVTLFCVALAVLAYRRGTLLDDFFTSGDVTVQELSDADNMVSTFAWALIGLQVGAAVLLAIWAHRTVSNAKRRHPYSDVSPSWVAGGWFIPVANLIVPWIHLRRACTAGAGRAPAATRGATPRSLHMWQAAFALQFVLNRVASGMGKVEGGLSRQDAIDEMHRQGIYFFLVAALLALGTLAASKAMPQVDAAAAEG